MAIASLAASDLSFAVTAACSWAASTASGWITLKGPAAGEGNGIVTFDVAANPGPARTGYISAGDKTFTVNQAAYAGVSPVERQALLDLYNATNGPGWTNSTGWGGAEGTECTWYGVTCGVARPGYALQDAGLPVTVLDLSNNNLVGTIPASIMNLVGLIDLRLSNNQLSGSIPAGIGNLTNLTNLCLGNNLFTGTLPSTIGNLVNLLYLNVPENGLFGDIPSQVGNLTDLRELDLGVNEFSGTIPSELLS